MQAIHQHWLRLFQMNRNVVLESELTCPSCGYKKTEVMPTDACQWFYECQQCHSTLKPQIGDEVFSSLSKPTITNVKESLKDVDELAHVTIEVNDGRSLSS